MQPDKQRLADADDCAPVTLETLQPGDCGSILGIDAGEALYHRLAALGLRIGKRVRLLRRAPFDGPLHIRVGMTEIMLRPDEARCVRVAKEPRA